MLDKGGSGGCLHLRVVRLRGAVALRPRQGRRGPGQRSEACMAAAELSDADLCLALPSDTELALQILWANCPPGALVASGRLQVALRSQVLSLIHI